MHALEVNLTQSFILSFKEKEMREFLCNGMSGEAIIFIIGFVFFQNFCCSIFFDLTLTSKSLRRSKEIPFYVFQQMSST